MRLRSQIWCEALLRNNFVLVDLNGQVLKMTKTVRHFMDAPSYGHTEGDAATYKSPFTS